MSWWYIIAACALSAAFDFLSLKISKTAVTYIVVVLQFAVYAGLYFLTATMVQLLTAVMFTVAAHFIFDAVMSKRNGEKI